MQLSFPVKQEPIYSSFQQVLRENGIIQPSLLFKSHVIAFGFAYDVELLKEFLSHIKESYSFRKLESNRPRQIALLSTILFNEIRSIEESLKDEKLAI